MPSLFPSPALPQLAGVPLTVFPNHPCPYLPDRVATICGLFVGEIDAEIYRQLMDRGFRRSGRLIYQPVCENCRACIPNRIPVDRFVMSKSQRRCWRRNQDLIVEVAAPIPTDEKYDLYLR